MQLQTSIYPLFQSLSLYEKRILLIAAFVHIICAWFSIGYHHPDEHFQLVEFANYKLGRTPLHLLPWEYPAEMRPGLQPLMVYLLLKPYYALGFHDPFPFTTLLRLLSGAMAFFTAWAFHKAIKEQIKSTFLQNAHLALSLLTWCLVFMHVRFSSENWAAICFTWALITLWRKTKWSYWLFGLLVGFSFIFRFQAIFMIAAAGLWMIVVAKTKWVEIGKVFIGFTIAFAIGLLCEYWLYGHWTLSAYNYVFQNVVENKAANFGVQPWYWYFEQIAAQALPPFSILLLLSIPIMLIYKPKHMLTWCMIFFLLGHIVVAHKELRFLYPLAFFYPFYVVMSIEYLSEKYKNYHHAKWYLQLKIIGWRTFWGLNSIFLLLVMTKPANDLLALNKILHTMIDKETIIVYSTGFEPNYINGEVKYNTFYAHPQATSFCIDRIMNDTNALKGKNILIFSDHAFAKDEFIFQYAGPYFDSSRTTVLYQKSPAWMHHFNFNHWLERSNPYTIYQLHND